MPASLPPLFGANVDPAAADPRDPFRRAVIAEENGLDLITIQDHPYNSRHMDTWTLLAALGGATERIHLGTNVISTPLRPPIMLAKMAATLDVITSGRLELGLGAGGYPQGITNFGGQSRPPTESFAAFEDVLRILRGMWENAGKSFRYEGKIHQVTGAKLGPAPAHRIPIWVGASGPRMLRLVGRLADGVLVSSIYERPKRLKEINELIDIGAAQANRQATAIRRGYNLSGVIDLGRADTKLENPRNGHVYGPVDHWVEEILRYYQDYRQDTFICWPVAGNERLQIEAFAQQVVPAVRAVLQGGNNHDRTTLP